MYENAGNISASCSSVNISRSTYDNYLSKDPVFRQAIEEVMQFQIDIVESMLLRRIREGDTAAIIFYLKTKGRDRGYEQTSTLNIKEGPQIIAPGETIEAEAEAEDITTDED